jgi:predicted TIM-barrel fold metal-dependent hydrolase
MWIDETSVNRYLSIMMDLAQSVTLTDCHVHPFEVIYDQGIYEPNPQFEGVYSNGKTNYVPLCPGPFELDPLTRIPPKSSPDLAKRMMLLALRCMYAHTGPRYCMDQANIAGIQRLILLPVAHPGKTAEVQLAKMARYFGKDPRFPLGYSLPNTLMPHEVEKDVRRNMESYGIKVLKLHPNLSGHDLTSHKGIDRVNALMDVSKKMCMPVIIHGGPSQVLNYSNSARFGELNNLENIDFGRTDQTVVIAHGGFYGLNYAEVKATTMPLLIKIMEKYNHLFIDTSSLTTKVLDLIIKNVDFKKILFGSDSYYEPSWKSAIKFFWVLEKNFNNPEELFSIIAGKNPDKLFEKRSDDDVTLSIKQISSVSGILEK